MAKSLAFNPGAAVVASDISGAALEVASLNFQINNIRKVPLLRKRDMLEGIHCEFGLVDLIVSNPPFFSEGRFVSNGFDPETAINGGQEGKRILSSRGVIILQVQEIKLSRVMATIEEMMPSASLGLFRGPCYNKICAIIVGPEELVKKYSQKIIF